MTWGKDLPKTSGYHWFRGTLPGFIAKDPVIVFLSLGVGGVGATYALHPFLDQREPVFPDAFVGEWSGPVLPPQ